MFWTEWGRIIKGFLDQCCLAFVKNIPSQWMKKSFRSSRRPKEKISSTVLVSFLSQRVLKENFRFLQEPINSFPHCWIIPTGDATETEPVTVLTTWFCFCENVLQHKREEGREKSLEKATWSSWSGRSIHRSQHLGTHAPFYRWERWWYGRKPWFMGAYSESSRGSLTQSAKDTPPCLTNRVQSDYPLFTKNKTH